MRRETVMRDFGTGWSGLKEFACSRGVATVDDTDDIVAAKIKAVIQGTLPEEEPTDTPVAWAPPVVTEEDNDSTSEEDNTTR